MMKHPLRFLLLFLLLIGSIVPGLAYSFEKDGIYYNITSSTDHTVAVTYRSNYKYSGEVTIPESVDYNGENYQVTSIGSDAFEYCSSLASVTIPESVTSIGSKAFYGCSSLASVTIPESVTSIGSSAFSGCKALTGLVFNAENCTSCGSEIYPAFPSSISSLSLGEKVTAIPSYFLYSGSQFELVEFPSTLVKIGESAFRNASLTSVNIPESVTYIGNSAFNGCSSLTSVVIPRNVTSVGSDAFRYCSNLKKNAYPSTINNPFSNGNSISYPVECSIDEHGVIYDEGMTMAYYAPMELSSDYVLPVTLASIGESAYRLCTKLASVTIPESVTSIGSSAFENCSSLASVTIPESVTSIGNSAFSGCNKIERIIIPNTVLSIGTEAFKNNGLKSITMGSAVQTIGINAFSRSSGRIAKAIWLCNTPPSNASSVGARVNYVANDQYSLSNQVKYDFLSSTFTVDGAVYVPVSPAERTCNLIDCTYEAAVTDINLTDKVSNKGIELTVKNIGQYAFYDNDYLTNVEISNDGMIGDNAFYGCGKVESLKVANNGSVGSSAFSNNSSLLTVDLRNIGAIGSSTFSGLKNLTNVVLGDSVSSINSNAFSGCSAIPELIIPNSVKSLGASAFEGCSALVSITIGTGMTTLPSRLFYGCSSLADITVPNNISIIEDYVFSYCTSLTDVTLEDMDEEEEESALVREPQVFDDWTSTNHGSNTTSEKEYTFNVQTGDVLSFNYRVSSESNYDYLTVFINGSQVVRVSGSASNTYSRTFSGSMTVTLRMTYSKDSSGDSGYDSGYLSNIVVTPGEPTVPQHLLTVGSNGSNPLFSSCPLDEVYIGRRLRYNTSSDYGYSPFYRNTSLRSVEISDAETMVSDNEFYGCSNLKSITIGNGVTSIGNWAFSGCSALDYFSAGFNVETIGQEAFSDCTALTTYHSFSIVPPVCGAQALDDINKWECTLFVPAKSSDEYAAADQWKEFFFVNETDAVIIEELSLSPDIINGLTGDTAQIEAEIIPANATRKSLNWTSEDESVATVDENGLVKFLKEGATIITVRTTDGSSLSAAVNVLVSVKNPELGDSNANGTVNIADAVNTANYAIGNEVAYIDVVAADVNQDGKVTLSDASATVALILDQPSATTVVTQAPPNANITTRDLLAIDNFEATVGETVEIVVKLNDTREYVALQGDITVPEGMALISAAMGSRVADTHTLATKRINDRKMRVAIFDAVNCVFAENDEAILLLTLKVDAKASGMIEINNAVSADARACEYKLASIGGNHDISTGIDVVGGANASVSAENGYLLITDAENQRVIVNNAEGVVVADFKASSDVEKVNVPAGVYVVTVAETIAKLIVK